MYQKNIFNTKIQFRRDADIFYNIPVPPNGIVTTLLGWQLTSVSSFTPTISGLTFQTSTSLPEKSLLLNIYQDSKKAETRDWPVQALQNCFRLSFIYFSPLMFCSILSSVTREKSPNVHKSCPKRISLEKLKILAPTQKLPKTVGDLGKLIIAKGFKKLPKVQ